MSVNVKMSLCRGYFKSLLSKWVFMYLWESRPFGYLTTIVTRRYMNATKDDARRNSSPAEEYSTQDCSYGVYYDSQTREDKDTACAPLAMVVTVNSGSIEMLQKDRRYTMETEEAHCLCNSVIPSICWFGRLI